MKRPATTLLEIYCTEPGCDWASQQPTVFICLRALKRHARDIHGTYVPDSVGEECIRVVPATVRTAASVLASIGDHK